VAHYRPSTETMALLKQRGPEGQEGVVRGLLAMGDATSFQAVLAVAREDPARWRPLMREQAWAARDPAALKALQQFPDPEVQAAVAGQMAVLGSAPAAKRVAQIIADPGPLSPGTVRDLMVCVAKHNVPLPEGVLAKRATTDNRDEIRQAVEQVAAMGGGSEQGCAMVRAYLEGPAKRQSDKAVPIIEHAIAGRAKPLYPVLSQRLHELRRRGDRVDVGTWRRLMDAIARADAEPLASVAAMLVKSDDRDGLQDAVAGLAMVAAESKSAQTIVEGYLEGSSLRKREKVGAVVANLLRHQVQPLYEAVKKRLKTGRQSPDFQLSQEELAPIIAADRELAGYAIGALLRSSSMSYSGKANLVAFGKSQGYDGLQMPGSGSSSSSRSGSRSSGTRGRRGLGGSIRAANKQRRNRMSRDRKKRKSTGRIRRSSSSGRKRKKRGILR